MVILIIYLYSSIVDFKGSETGMDLIGNCIVAGESETRLLYFDEYFFVDSNVILKLQRLKGLSLMRSIGKKIINTQLI